VDSTVDQLMATWLAWARHRQCKLSQLCAGLREGKVILFDKDYYVFDF